MGIQLDRVGCAALAVALCATVLTDQTMAQHLPEAVRAALRHHPEVQAAAANLRATVQGYEQAAAGRFPVVDARAGYGREETESPSTRASGQGSRSLTRNEANVTLRQNLYDGSQVRSQMETQSFRVDTQRARLAEAADFIAFRACEAYLDALRDARQVALSRVNVSRHESTWEKVDFRARSGVGQRVDLQQAQARLELARSNLVSAQGAEQDSAARYERVVGRPPGQLVPPESQQTAIPPELESAKWAAARNSYGVKAAESELEAARAAVRVTRADRHPRLDLELAANRNRDIEGIPGTINDHSAMLVMRYNLFRGGADEARIREAMERETGAIEALRNARQFTDESVARAWHALATARDRLKYLEGHVQATEKVLGAYFSQFELGRRSLLDLLNAENELFQARAALEAGIAASRLGEYRLLATMGLLVQALGLGDEVAKLDARIER